MGLTPLFELFAGPLSFHLANYVQRFGWGCSSKKSNPRLPRQTGVNRTVHTLSASCTVIKVMYDILHWVSYSKLHTICNNDTLWLHCIDEGSPGASVLMTDLRDWYLESSEIDIGVWHSDLNRDQAKNGMITKSNYIYSMVQCFQSYQIRLWDTCK